MMPRAEFWYIFGLAAMAIAFHRLLTVKQTNWRDPVTLSFSTGIFGCVLGVLTKQPILAQAVDTLLGANAAWVLADCFFLVGLWGLTCWIDFMQQPTLPQEQSPPWQQFRLVGLIGVNGLMMGAATTYPALWATLERGGIDLGGNLVFLLARASYFLYSVWGLSYLSYRFYQLRRPMRNRINYLRLSLAWAAVTLALIAPVVQSLATLEGFLQPAVVPIIWPSIWMMVSTVQSAVVLLVLALFFEPVYRFVSWLDKQRLIRRLLRTHRLVIKQRPDLPIDQLVVKTSHSSIKEPDRQLATLVNEFEIIHQLVGGSSTTLTVPAGSLMTDDLKRVLQTYRRQFQQTLSTGQPLDLPTATGDTYTLARWYAHL